MIQTIIVPLDGSEFSERALPVSMMLAHALNARIVLVCVAGAKTAVEWDFTDEDRRAISEQYTDVHEEDHLLSTETRTVEYAQRQIRAVAEAECYLQNVAA